MGDWPDWVYRTQVQMAITRISPVDIDEFGHTFPHCRYLLKFLMAICDQDFAPTAAAMARQVGAQG